MNALRAYGGSRGLAPFIFNVDAAWKWVEYFNRPTALTSNNKPRYALNEMLGGYPHTVSTFRRKELIIYVKWFCFEVQWSEVKLWWSSWAKSTSTMYIRVTLCWGYLFILWLYNLLCLLYCCCFNFFCNVWVSVLVCVGVLVICLLVFTVFCIVCTVFLYCFVYVYLFLFVLSVLV